MKRMIYCDNDPDGWMSAAILLKEYPDAELTICIRYQNPKFVEGYDEVYIVDYSFNKEQMDFLKNNNKKLIWIDHHITKIEEYKDNYDGLQRLDKAGAGLTWEYIHNNKPMPQAVKHINNHDLWNLEDPNTHYFSLFIGTLKYGTEIEEYQKMISWTKDQYKQAYDVGKILDIFLERELEEQLAVGIEQEFLGYKAFVMYGESNRSKLANKALEKYPHIQMTAVVRGEKIVEGKKLFKYSLRSRKGEDVDVSKLAQEFGGGGHKHAAAFTSEKVL